VTVSFKNADNTIISENTINIEEEQNRIINSALVHVHVNPENIPSTEDDEEVSRYIIVTVTCPQLAFSQDKNVLLSLEGGFFFIQTDKPIYTPKQTVKMRLISLNKR
ncbi:hypothetical protein, partial [Salmonella sp. s51884]|uniref:hypothetical protein n=1 Tax=Salmonella sp. s51884 TaxID=3159654 RepID=UPI00398079CC